MPGPTTTIALLAVGLGIGLLAGLFGIGGGILAIPGLTLLLHLDQHLAQGTSLATIVPTTAFAAYRYARRDSVHWRAAAWVGGAALAVGFASAHLALALPARLLRSLFALFLLYVAVRTMRHRSAAATTQSTRAAREQAPTQAGIGGAVGLLAGLLGVGGGSIATPALVLLCGFPQQLAQGTSLAAIVLSSSAGTLGYALAGSVDWMAAAILFAGAAATVPAGTALAHRLPELHLRRVFAALLCVIAVLELTQGL